MNVGNLTGDKNLVSFSKTFWKICCLPAEEWLSSHPVLQPVKLCPVTSWNYRDGEQSRVLICRIHYKFLSAHMIRFVSLTE
jgi:hypothetical protein